MPIAGHGTVAASASDRRRRRPSAHRRRDRRRCRRRRRSSPVTPASTTTERQTWRRVIPAARRTPISRTRSRTFMVRVLTMPSAATMTAMSASASNRPKTRSRASPMAPWIRPSVGRLEGQGASLVGERVRAVPRWRSASKRTANASAPARPRRAASVQPTSQDSPDRPGQRPFGDGDDGQREARPIGGGRVDRRHRPRGRRGRRRRPGRWSRHRRSSAARAAARSPSTRRSRPSASEVRADHRGGIDAHAIDRQVEGRDRADRGDAGQRPERLDETLVARHAGRSR